MVRHTVTSADAQQLERIQREVVALCCTRFCSPDCNGHSYASACHFLNLRTLRDGRHKLGQILLIIFFVLNHVHLPRTLLVYEVPFGISETFPCFMLVHPSKTVPPPGVPLRQIQVVVTLIPSEGTLSQTYLILFLVLLHKVP